MPETRGKTLEDIDASFRRKSSNIAEADDDIRNYSLEPVKDVSGSSSLML